MRLLFNDSLSGRPVEHVVAGIDHEYSKRRDEVAVLVHAEHATLTLIVKYNQQVYLVDGGVEHTKHPKLIGKSGVLR